MKRPDVDALFEIETSPYYTDKINQVAQYIAWLEGKIKDWINVKDRLPEYSTRALVWRKDTFDEVRSYAIDIWLGDKWHIIDGYKHADFKVLYWMSLPDPPEDE